MSSYATFLDWYAWSFGGDPDWSDGYATSYTAAEQWLSGSDAVTVRSMAEDVEALLMLPAERDRMSVIPGDLPGAGPEAGAADVFLTALLARCHRSLAGDDTDPLVDPPSDDVRHPPYELPALDEEARTAVHELVDGEYSALMFSREELGEACTPVLRVPVAGLGLQAVEAATGRVLPATVGCVVVHSKTRLIRPEPPLIVSTWVEPQRPALEGGLVLPGLAFLFGAYYRPTWHRDFSGLVHGPAVSFGLEQEPDRVARCSAEIELLLGLEDEEARRRALIAVGSSHVPVLPGRTDRLLLLAARGLANGAQGRVVRAAQATGNLRGS